MALPATSRRLLCMLSLCAALVASGCGQPRRYGDEGGVPVTVTVHLDRAFVNGMANRQGRVGVGVGAAFSSGGGRSVGTGVGMSFSSTIVNLVGGDAMGEAGVFRKELEWGENTFQVPLKPGRNLALTVHVEGGRQGWESVGMVTIPSTPTPQVRVELTADGGKVTVQ